MDKKLIIANFLDDTPRVDLQLSLLAGKSGLKKTVTLSDINRPGLTLAGFFDFFAHDRIQIFGLGETAYMRQLLPENRSSVYSKFFSYEVLCCIFTHNEKPDDLFLRFADEAGVPVMVTRRDTTRFTSILIHFLDSIFAPKVTLHATLVDVFGIGILLMGKSGVGKSECALELVERGHRLVADDMVTVKKADETMLMGSGSPLLKHHMEIRGLGIINVQDIFGIRSVRNRKRIELVALLEEWDANTEYDRLGLEEKKYTILDIDVPFITVPVRPGRNIPIIIEAAALDQRLKKSGTHSARDLDKRIQDWISTEKK